MVTNKKILFLAFILTLFLFISIYFTNILINKARENAILERMDMILENYEDMQTLSLMADVYGDEGICLSMDAMLTTMNKDIWDTGGKIDQYRLVTEDFMEDPFYLEQKRRFNRNEVLYFSMLKQMKEKCAVHQTAVLFFYKKKEACPDCDAQSFVLTDVKKDLELAVFSFDSDLALAPVAILESYYNITTYPCTVVDETPYCGLYDKTEISAILCRHNVTALCANE